MLRPLRAPGPSTDWRRSRRVLVFLALMAPTVAEAAPPSVPLAVALAPSSAVGDPGSGVARRSTVVIQGKTMPGRMVGMDADLDGKVDRTVLSDRQGRFDLTVGVAPGLNARAFNVAGMALGERVMLRIVNAGGASDRPFNGSPIPRDRPFTRIIPHSVAYAPGLPPRPDARDVSAMMAENPAQPAFSPNIELGLVFFGQFIDHDLTLNLTQAGQGPSPSPARPVNLRTPALDLDSVYGLGPKVEPQFYTPDGLSFRLGAAGNDLPRNEHGVAQIPEARNDDNGIIASIHLAFLKYHNLLLARALDGVDPATLSPPQKDALFGMVRADVLGFFQGIVANEFGPAITGRAISVRGLAPIENVPVEFSAAAFRLGHTLVPNTIMVDATGRRLRPIDPALRRGVIVPYALLFGPRAQPASAFDGKLSDTMRMLLIPLSPTDPGQGDLIGGSSPNIGGGRIVDGVMHLDLAETNTLRGREQHLPSGEEYLAMALGQPYNPATDGNTDLFFYVMNEATPFGHLGRVGRDIVERTIGGTLAADPYRYDNPAVWSPRQIRAFRAATMEKLLGAINTPGFP